MSRHNRERRWLWQLRRRWGLVSQPRPQAPRSLRDSLLRSATEAKPSGQPCRRCDAPDGLLVGELGTAQGERDLNLCAACCRQPATAAWLIGLIGGAA